MRGAEALKTKKNILQPTPRKSRGKAGSWDPQRCLDPSETGAQKPGRRREAVDAAAGQFPRTSASRRDVLP